MSLCENKDCKNDSNTISRISPKGLLIRNRNKTNSFIDAYKKYNYCKTCHDYLLRRVWENITVDN
mgnify:FL=1